MFCLSCDFFSIPVTFVLHIHVAKKKKPAIRPGQRFVVWAPLHLQHQSQQHQGCSHPAHIGCLRPSPACGHFLHRGNLCHLHIDRQNKIMFWVYPRPSWSTDKKKISKTSKVHRNITIAQVQLHHNELITVTVHGIQGMVTMLVLAFPSFPATGHWELQVGSHYFLSDFWDCHLITIMLKQPLVQNCWDSITAANNLNVQSVCCGRSLTYRWKRLGPWTEPGSKLEWYICRLRVKLNCQWWECVIPQYCTHCMEQAAKYASPSKRHCFFLAEQKILHLF